MAHGPRVMHRPRPGDLAMVTSFSFGPLYFIVIWMTPNKTLRKRWPASDWHHGPWLRQLASRRRAAGNAVDARKREATAALAKAEAGGDTQGC